MKSTLGLVFVTLLALQARANFCVDPADYSVDKEATAKCENLNMDACMAANGQSSCLFEWSEDDNECQIHGTRAGAADTSLVDCCTDAGGSADDITTCGQQWAYVGFTEGDTCETIGPSNFALNLMLKYLGDLGCCGEGLTSCSMPAPNFCTNKDQFQPTNTFQLRCIVSESNCSDTMDTETCQYEFDTDDNECTIRGSGASQCCGDVGGFAMPKSCDSFLTTDFSFFMASINITVGAAACPNTYAQIGGTLAGFIERSGFITQCCGDEEVSCVDVEVFEANGPPSPPPPPSPMCKRTDRFREDFTAMAKCTLNEAGCLAARATSSCNVEEYDEEEGGCELRASLLTDTTGAAGCCTAAGGTVQDSTTCDEVQSFLGGFGYDIADADVCESEIFDSITRVLLQSHRTCCTDGLTYCDADSPLFTYEQSNDCLNPTYKNVFTFGEECNKFPGDDETVYIKATAAGGNCSVEFYSDSACSVTTTNPLETEIGTSTVVNGDCYESTQDDGISQIRIFCGDSVPDLPDIPGVVIDDSSAGVLAVGAALSALYLL